MPSRLAKIAASRTERKITEPVEKLERIMIIMRNSDASEDADELHYMLHSPKEFTAPDIVWCLKTLDPAFDVSLGAIYRFRQKRQII